MSKRVWMYLAVLAVVVLIAAPATAQLLVERGSDLFVTPGGGQTAVDLADYPIQKAFGNSAYIVGETVVTLKGKPIAGLGQTDTVVERTADVTLPGLFDPENVGIVLRGLSLVSEKPVQINRGGVTEAWDLLVSVSPTTDSTGTMTLQQTSEEGGVFDSQIDVLPYLIFTNGNQEVEIDCGALGCATMTLRATDGPWVRTSRGGFSPGGAGVPNIADETPYDGDSDGFADDEFIGGSNVFPGFLPTSPYPEQEVTHDHDDMVAFHKPFPNDECDDDGPVIGDAELSRSQALTSGGVVAQPALCPQVADPVDPSEPSEPAIPTDTTVE